MAKVDWINEFLDAIDGRVDDNTRARLSGLLETAYLEPGEFELYWATIWSDDLNTDDLPDLFRRLQDCQPHIRDMYAPNQTQLAKWIRSFCNTTDT